MSFSGSLRLPAAHVLLWIAVLPLLACASSGPIVAPPPKPTAAPTGPKADADGDISVADENGLRIIVKHTPSAELAAIHLNIKGGARFRTRGSAGVEALALRAAVTGGTSDLDKDAFAKKLSQLGSELGTSSSHGYSVIAAKALTEQLAPTFELLVSAFLDASMQDSEIELHRQRMLVAIKRRTVTPDGRLHLLVTEAMYKGHPYEYFSNGSEESITHASTKWVRQHLQAVRSTTRLELVVVGNVDMKTILKLVRKRLGKLPRGDYDPLPMLGPTFTRSTARIEPADLPTHYIEASFIGPRWKDPEFAAAILAMRILRSRLFEEVRTKRNLSYAPSARFSWGNDITRGSLYVTAVKANETMTVMFDEARRLQKEPVPERVLAGEKAVFLTSHLMSNESAYGQASWIARCDIIGGDWKLSRTLPEKIKDVSSLDIREFATKYMNHLQTVVLGDESSVDEAVMSSM